MVEEDQELVTGSADLGLQSAGHEAGVRPSMGSGGAASDNALVKGFCATLDCEGLDRRRFATQAQARMAVFTFIGFSNPVRRHSALGYRSPVRHEHERLTGPSPAG
jgi:putative transposase